MHQTRYPSKRWVFKSRFSFKIRQHGQQQLYIQYKVCWILYKMKGTPSFLQPYLWIQPMLQSPPKIHSSTPVNFHLPIAPLFVPKIILTIPLTLPFSISQQFFTSLFLRTTIPAIYTKNHCVKSVQIRRYFWSEYRKIRTINNSVFGNFSGSVLYKTSLS